MEKLVEKTLLYERYAPLLTAHQRMLYEESVYHDLSLAEIAERHGVSRQGVSDLLARTTKALYAYEEKLGYMRRFRRIDALCNQIDKAAGKELKKLTGAIRKELA